MLESIYGKIESADGQEIVVSIENSWSLKLLCPNASIYTLNESYQIVTELIWKDQGPSLFGFSSKEERAFFRSLLKIASIGPKLALCIMNHPRQKLFESCRTQNAAELLGISGIGKKTAQRLISEIEIKDIPQESLGSSLSSQLFSALENFGFSRQMIEKALAQTQAQDFSQGLKEALKYLRGAHASARE